MVFGLISGSDVIRANEGYGIGLVRNTSFGRKRVALANTDLKIGDYDDYNLCTTSKRHCFQDSLIFAEKSALEALPQDVLIRVLCGVEHDDLKRLLFVSKAIRQATVVAKQIHFAYSTPRKMVRFRNAEDFGDLDEIEAPNAPKQSRVPRSRLSAKKLADISVALFSSDNKEGGPRKDLFVEVDTEA